MARRQREHNLLTNIDVTPLVDLTFILLIVFMVTAPAMESRVTLPMMDANEPNPKTQNVTISLDDLGTIYLEREPISLDDLPGALQNMDKTGKVFAIRADESRAYGEVMSLMKAVKSAGIESVDLVTLNEQQ
ncbi:MAG: biopolymer transporter ExbD [Lentisphaeraceae bacterium]|nr:biopolymer transporter ExbD [Lentisphaeraceae bacterium]